MAAEELKQKNVNQSVDIEEKRNQRKTRKVVFRTTESEHTASQQGQNQRHHRQLNDKDPSCFLPELHHLSFVFNPWLQLYAPHKQTRCRD